ncbi:MAG: hypothetical protein KKA07_05975, partial [Bacteroidetes bacterium]|nr:hypothetical protein [Bacteroidota bacterium]MBU1718602.1 hypothetical protein [Bacteroidota bacterium]
MVIKPKIKNLLLIPGILLVGFLISQLFLASINDSVSLKTNNDFKDFSKQHYKIFSPYIPDSLTFCNSIVPLDQTEIKEALDLELLKNTYWHSSTLLVLKKFKRYMAIIDPVLKAYE